MKIIDERGMQKGKKKKKRKETRETEAIAKGWEINDFVERLSQVFFN